MPTVLRQFGFRFEIIPGDHEPPHVHVYYGGGTVKIELQPLVVKSSAGISQRDAVRARRITSDNLAYLLTRWERINGKH